VICSDVDTSSDEWKATGIKSTFTLSDDQVVVFVNFDIVKADTSYSFKWYTPSDDLVSEPSSTFDNPGHWSAYHSLPISI
jgi:hypothetical protein